MRIDRRFTDIAWRFCKAWSRMAVVLGVLCPILAVAVQGATAASLEGFGQIKFGMTEDEAWAAIDGAGEWRKERWVRKPWLDYEVQLREGDPPGRVSQHFVDGRAKLAVIIFDRSAAPGDCIGYGRRMAGWMAERHGVSPITRTLRSDVLSAMYILGPSARDVVFEQHEFGFDGGAYIRVWVSSRFGLGGNTGQCSTIIKYMPPALTPVPF